MLIKTFLNHISNLGYYKSNFSMIFHSLPLFFVCTSEHCSGNHHATMKVYQWLQWFKNFLNDSFNYPKYAGEIRIHMSVFMQMSELKFTIKQDAALTQVFNLV